MAADHLHGELVEVANRIEKAAYERGWADAIRHVMSAAQSASASSKATVQEATPPRKAAYGSIIGAIDSALDDLGDRGISPSDVVQHARNNFGEELLESSVRGRLNRMAKQKKLRNDRGRWFRMKTIDWDGAASQAVSVDDGPSTDNQDDSWNGGRNAAA